MAFIAGILAVPMFSRVLWLVLYVADVAPSASFSDLIWSSLRGGVWGVVFQLTLLRWFRGAAYWVAVVLAGGVAPTLVQIFVVWPLKFGTMQPDAIRYFVICSPFSAIWGFGWSLLLALFQKCGRLTWRFRRTTVGGRSLALKRATASRERE